MHDTLELEEALQRDEYTRKFDPRVFAADQPPQKLPPRYLYILNTDPISKGGTHWVLIFRRDANHPPVFFDSYGKAPSWHYAGWKRFDGFRRSTEDFQQVHTTVCGDHCLYVGRRLAAGYALNTILQSYDAQDEKHNDEAVFSLVHSRFKFLNQTGHDNTVKRKYKQNCQVSRPRRIQRED